MTPRATYRLQLHAGFTFGDAAAAVPYLAELGISHLYLSPILHAAEGSTHGYDVVDPERISDVLGGETGLRRLVEAAHGAGLGLLVDIVPNHMSIAGSSNRWWMDVLENGPSSAYAHFFDVDWGASADDRVLLPILAERYGRAIQTRAIEVIHRGNGRFAVRADELVLPLSPRTLGTLVRRASDRIDHAELAFVGDALAALPSLHRRPDAAHGRLGLTSEDIAARWRRHRDKRVLVGRLAALSEEPACAAALADEIAAVNADPTALDAILEAQAYRLAHWSVAGSQLPYRRFFDISTLVAIRNEDLDVFEACHGKVLELAREGSIEGLRIDHVDGLRDPEAYLKRLRERLPGTWLVIEKILIADETVPASWPVDGTTGYEFMEKVGGLLVDPDAEPALTRLFEAMTGEPWRPGEASRKARLDVMSDALHSELARLTELAARACAASPACRDYTRPEIETALSEILAGYPTYRTYLHEGAPASNSPSIDRARIASSVQAAADARPDIDRDLLAYLEGVLAFERPPADSIELAYSTQQVTGAIAAKGDEDTLNYRQVRLLARNEVGAELRQLAHTPFAVHRALAAGRPRALLATSTHDSKRSEDVRARIAVISEVPEAWSEALVRWRAHAERHWDVQPDRVIEYTMFQTLVGAWPLPLARARAYAHKATREARRRTSWRHPDADYEAALDRWLDRVYGDHELMADLVRFAAELAPHGDRNALAQLLIKLAAPGVPDFYQGSELHDDSLVDPDNRRALDLAARRERLRWIGDANARMVLDTADLGTMKLWVIRRVLGLRRRSLTRFEAAYRPLDAEGPHAHRVFAFARGDALVAIVPRLGVRAEGWRETGLAIPPGTWRDVLSDQEISGGTHALAALWRHFPVALLTTS